MNTVHRNVVGFFCALVFAGLTGCSNKPLEWTEDVLLPDGRVVTLTRYQEFEGPHEIGDTPTESDYWFEFKHPDTGEIVRWESNRDLATLALLFDGETPLLLTRPNFGGVHRRNCPNPPYLLFRYDAGWHQVDLGTIAVRRIRVNVTASPKGRRELIRSSSNHLSVEKTQDSRHINRPYIINFDLMTKQTFGPENCGRTVNYLVGWGEQG
jgi:hypothetical protein